MKTLPVIFVLLFTTGAQSPSVRLDLLKTHDRYLEALQRPDRNVGDFLAPEFAAMDTRGQLRRKQEFLAGFPVRLNALSAEIQFYSSDSAVIVGSAALVSAEEDARIAYSAVWVRRARRWQLAFYHAAPRLD